MILYCDCLAFVNGISVWALNFCKNFYKDHKIFVISKYWNKILQKEFEDYAETITYNNKEVYNTDIALISYSPKGLPNNIISKKEFIILHCDYGGVDYKTPPIFPKNKKYIAVSELAANNFSKKFNIDCDYIEGLMIRKPLNSPILRLISATRLDPNKGIERMTRLCELLNKNNIKYKWDNYSSNGIGTHFYKNTYISLNQSIDHDLLLDYIADSDYLVQLSEYEGYCRVVHESLLVGTPVLVTDVPIFQKIIQNGYNGYRLPLDMDNINVNNIADNIPKYFKYENNFNECINKWNDILRKE